MFVRIVLDTAVETKALIVPGSAVVEIDGKTGVFVPEGDDGHNFAFKPVKLGRESGDRRVVASGISPGTAVVSEGAFTLKSELILQNETEEE
jgi:membrane fusion protein, heavy metal efflux system